MSTFGQSTANVTGTARVRDGDSGEILLEVVGPQIIAAALSDSGKLLALQFPNQRIELWSVTAAEKLFDWNFSDTTSTLAQQSDLAFSPQDQQLGVVNASKGTIDFLDLRQIRAEFQRYRLQWQ